MRLSDNEREMLREATSSLAGVASLTALCAYGSKVAGYARPDSDYDILVVARKFGDGVRYRYLESPMAISALIVEENLLLADARTSALGEFVMGRLLNVYEPIVNGELLKKVEVEYKRRVIVEALVELSGDYGEFCRNLIIPYDFFLFNKLRKRSQVYPPALYSYVQTYTCGRGAENREFALGGFKEAASQLASTGFLMADTDDVRVVPEKMKGDAFTRLSSLFSLTARGVTQYAVHGYAGRVGLSVFRREATSKLTRIRASAEPLPEFERPRLLLQLEEGIVIADASKMKAELAKMSGFSEYRVKERDLGDPYATTSVLTLVSGTVQRSFVVKNFADVRSLKWALLGFWAMTARRFSMTPIARLEREYRASRLLRAKGINTPTIVAVAPDERIMVKEFIEGPTLSKLVDGLLRGGDTGLEQVVAYAEVLAKAHAAGLALGDAKASNVVVSKEGLFLTDLEQAVEGGDTAWDLAEFLYFTAKLRSKEGEMEKVTRAFLSAYADKGDPSVIRKARSARYLQPFQPFLTPGMSNRLRSLMGEYG